VTRALTILVIGPTPGAREAAILAAIDPAVNTTVILEGLSDGSSDLNDAAQARSSLQLIRIASGCICCSGNLVMRTMLNRVLRNRPQRLFISLADAAHLEQIRRFLLQEPYGEYLSLTKELTVFSRSST
jgi:G3E family GTPase